MLYLRFGPRTVRLPGWTLALAGLGAFALISLLTIVAAGVALVAVPVVIAGAWLTRLGMGRRGGLARQGVRREAAPRPTPRRPAPTDIIDATYTDVTGKR